MDSQKPTKDVTIIGAGAVGLNSALSILESGQTVEVVDRDEPAAGASHGNAGVIAPWNCVPQAMPGVWKSVPKWLLDPDSPLTVRWRYFPKFLPWGLKFLAAGKEHRIPEIADAMLALNQGNVDLYRHHLNGTGHEGLVRDATYLHVFRDPAAVDMDSLAWRLRKERGVPMRVLNADELYEIEPDVSRDYKAAVVIEGQARALDPGAIGRALAEKAQGMGAEIHRAAVNGVRRAEGSAAANGARWVVATDRGNIAAKTVVIAAGAWSSRLLEPFGIKVPLEAERGYHVVLKDPGISVNSSIMDTGAKFVASEMSAGVRCAGTAEFAGIDAPPDFRRAQSLLKHAKRLFPKLNTDDVTEWMGSRPSLPDSLPAIGPVPGQENLFVAFGHAHNGFSMAPITGRLVSQIVRGAQPNTDMKPYRLERF